MSDSTPWTTLRVWAGPERDAVIAALFDAGAEGIHELGESLVTQGRNQAAVDALASAVRTASPEARIETEPLANVDWSIAWRQSIRVQTIGELTVAPPWLATGLDAARTIVIDPGMAFGTGDHATTRGVIRLLQRVITAGDRVADLGAGSAILSIAAAKRGAAYVAAIELDPDAIGNAEENVRRNGVGDRVTVIEGDAGMLLPLVAPVRVILANIVSSVLIALLPLFALVLPENGRAILSGMLLSERPDLIRELFDAGWQVEAEELEGDWWSATIARR